MAYRIVHPFQCNLPGGLIALRAEVVVHDLHYAILPQTDWARSNQGSDVSLYKALRWKYHHGYLCDTEATHLKAWNGSQLISCLTPD